MPTLRLHNLLTMLALALGLVLVGCPPTGDDDDSSDDDDASADDDDSTPMDDDDDDDVTPTDDDDTADPVLATCNDTGDHSMPAFGTLACGQDDFSFDFYGVTVEAGDCIDIYADNDAGAADLAAFAVDPAQESAYGLANDYSQLDDEVNCSTAPWDDYGCPQASVTAATAGEFLIGLFQWAGDGCADGAGYTFHLAINGVAVNPDLYQTAVGLEDFLANPIDLVEDPGDDDDTVGDDDDDSSATDDDDSATTDDDDSAAADDDDSAN